MDGCELVLMSLHIDPICDFLRLKLTLCPLNQYIKALLLVFEHCHVQKGKSVGVDQVINSDLFRDVDVALAHI